MKLIKETIKTEIKLINKKKYLQKELSCLRIRVRRQIKNREPNVFELEDLYHQISGVKDKLDSLDATYRASKYDGK